MSGYKAYQGQQIQGSGPLGLVLLSYDALHKSLGRAQMSIQAEDLATEADHTARAMEAIIELSSSLNFEAGEDVATSLASLYTYMMDKLASGMCSGKDDHIVEIIKLVQTLQEGWQQLADQQSGKTAAPIAKLDAAPQQLKQQPYATVNTSSRLAGYAA